MLKEYIIRITEFMVNQSQGTLEISLSKLRTFVVSQPVGLC